MGWRICAIGLELRGEGGAWLLLLISVFWGTYMSLPNSCDVYGSQRRYFSSCSGNERFAEFFPSMKKME